MALFGPSAASARFSELPTAGQALALLAAAALGLLLAVPELGPAAAGALVATVVVLAFIQPVAALAALLLVLPISSLLTIETGDFSITAMEPLMALLAIVWLGRDISERKAALDAGPLAWPLSLVLVLVLLSTLAAQRIGLAYKETIKWVELIVVLLFTTRHLASMQRQRAVLAALFVAGAAEALFGAFQYATGQGPTTFAVGEALRAYGHFEQPNPFAGYLGTILPLGLALALHRRPPAFALLATVAALCTALGIGLSLSRGAWLGVIFATAVMLVAWGPAGRRWVVPSLAGVALSMLLTAAGILPSAWTDRLAAISDNFGIFDVRTVQVNPENFAVVERMAHWQAGWYMFLDHPLIGVGAGNYPAAYDDYSLPGWIEPLGHAHNYYLNMAAETGLPGVAALLGLLFVVFRTVFAGLRAQPTGSFQHALLVGLLGSFVVLSVHNLFDNLLVHGMQIQVGFLLGLVVLAARPAADGGPVSLS